MTEMKTCGGRPIGSLVLSLCLPVGLALCILARPHLGLPNPPQPGDHSQVTGAAWGTSLGQNDPAAPRADVDPTRIYCAHKEYDALLRYRDGFSASLRAAKTLPERRAVRDMMAEYEDGYRCAYQEVTPQARRQAHLPPPIS